eukprot:COSAG01_NODE_7547_length_3156_cov_20.612692_5_plen_96_part_00
MSIGVMATKESHAVTGETGLAGGGLVGVGARVAVRTSCGGFHHVAGRAYNILGGVCVAGTHARDFLGGVSEVVGLVPEVIGSFLAALHDIGACNG